MRKLISLIVLGGGLILFLIIGISRLEDGNLDLLLTLLLVGAIVTEAALIMAAIAEVVRWL